ncbi:MAG: hypothetical protein HRT86_10320 [Ilumatobacteraceae bacterium]|nr:hypothetical protein [Ilumatobacteraceae bacterium]
MAIGNTTGEDLTAKYLGTAYDDIKFVADNLDAILAVSVDIDTVNNAVAITAADVVSTNADVVLTAADVILTAADVLKAQKWADESEDVIVESGLYSAKHWATKASASAASINSILTTANTFTLANTYDAKIVLSNLANVTAPLEIASTGAVGIKLDSGGEVRYLGVDNSGNIHYGTNPNHTSNAIVYTSDDINSSSLPFAASVLTVATSATIAGNDVKHAGNSDTSAFDWACKDLVVANSITIAGLTPYTSGNSNLVSIDWTVKDLTVAGAATITGLIVASSVPTLNSHLTNKFYVDQAVINAVASYADSVKLNLGDDDDLQISHNGITSVIDNFTGHFTVTNKSAGNDITMAVTADDGNLDTVMTLKAGTSDNSTVVLRYGDVQKFETAIDGIDVAGVVSGSVAPTDSDHLTRKDYVDTELDNQTHTMSEVSGNVPVSQVPVAVNNASAGAGFGGFRYTTEDAGATLNLFTT